MNIKYMWIVLKKEIKDTFRDKKTIFTSIIIPILIFPILSLAIGSGTSDFINETERPVDIAVIGDTENSFYEYLNEHKLVNIINVDDPYEALDNLKIKAIVRINEDFEENIENEKMGDIEIIFDQTSQSSGMGESRIRQIIGQFSNEIIAERLNERGINPDILNPVNIKSTSVSVEENSMGMFIMSMILPMLLSIWSAVGGIPAATDLGAGEKERQTLEPLLTTNASRLSIILGKYFTVVIAGIIGTIASLVGIIIASKVTPNFLGTGVRLPLMSIVVIALFCLGLTLTFSSLELAISFYARNFKEAQTYLTPLTIILLVPGYLTMYVDGKAIPKGYFNIPVVNTISIIKEALVSIFDINHILIVSGWTILYIAIAMYVTVKMFNKESVIFRN